MGFRHGATMENLPDVLLSNIFIRLLAKQLAQMRCVSKSWNSLLSESSFIKSHLNRSIQNNNNDGVLFVFPNVFSFASVPFTAHPSRSPDLELTDFIKLPINPQSNTGGGKVIGSVNGLICFKYGSNHHSEVNNYQLNDPEVIYGLSHSQVFYGSNHNPDVIYIWNPSLSALITLPPYDMPSHSIEQYLRFGFDPKTDDYKVVKVTRRIEIQTDSVLIKEWLPVEVYSMRKGSWKLTTQTIPSYVSNLSDCGKLCVDGHDGHIRWLAEIDHCWNAVDQLLEFDRILSFDLGTEKFREIPLPKSVTDLMVYDNENDVSMDLAFFDGKICVMSRALPDYECEVWVMNEYGVTESWVKLHDFPSFSGDLYTYGFTSHNEFCFQDVVSGLSLYDPVAAKTKIFKYHGKNLRVGKIVEYVNSLVWVTPEEQREMSCCSISRFQF